MTASIAFTGTLRQALTPAPTLLKCVNGTLVALSLAVSEKAGSGGVAAPLVAAADPGALEPSGSASESEWAPASDWINGTVLVVATAPVYVARCMRWRVCESRCAGL
jgi:hypothetical protein